MRFSFYCLLALVVSAAPAFANVIVTSPTNGETVSSPASFVATASTSTCSRGVASMGIYIDNELKYVVDGASLKTSLALPLGAHNAVLQEWDECGGATKTAIPVTVTNKTGVWVTSPANNATVVSSANFVASATSACAKGVASIGIYVNNQRVYLANGATLNAELTLSPGVQKAVVEEWDYCGGASTTPITLAVGSAGTTSPAPNTPKTLTNLQKSAWLSWGQEAPSYVDCGAPCPGVTWSMQHGVNSPSLSGDATEFILGGTKPYSDALFYNQLIGVGSTQGLPDTTHTLIPTLHNYVYTTDVYVSNGPVTQALEFDVNMFFNGIGMTFGTECRIAGGNEWDVWDNVNARWVPTGVACNPVNQAWNTVTVQVERDASNNLIFQSITLNGQTAVLNLKFPPFTVPADWYGVVCDFQMDGNFVQSGFNAYLDNTQLTYW